MLRRIFLTLVGCIVSASILLHSPIPTYASCSYTGWCKSYQDGVGGGGGCNAATGNDSGQLTISTTCGGYAAVPIAENEAGSSGQEWGDCGDDVILGHWCNYRVFVCNDPCGSGAGNNNGQCSGTAGGPCSGDCGSSSTCRAATAGNGGACGCHPKPSDDGTICNTVKECRKSCTGLNVTGASGCDGCNSKQVCCDHKTCCSPTDVARPALLLPLLNSKTTSTTVTLSWTPPTDWGDDCLNNTGKQFKVYWGPAPADPANPTPYLLGVYPSTQYFASFTGIPGKMYYWTVVAENGTKSATAYLYWFTITANTIQGKVYYDPNNTCSTTTPWNRGIPLTAQLTNPGTRTANVPGGGPSAGDFSITAPNATYGALRLLNLPNTYKCSTGCSQQCPSKSGVISPSTGNNYFITDQILSSEGWWQAVGGPVYAGSTDGGTTIRSELPLATSKLIMPGTGGGTDAALIRSTGNVDLGDGTVSTSGWSTKAAYKGKVTDYNYFAANMGVVQEQASDWASNVIDLATYPTTKNFAYIKPPSGRASLSGNWNIAAGQKYVIFVDGDAFLNFNVDVAPGGFLAIIAKGDVSVAAGVARVEGLYVASGDFITLTNYVANTTYDIPLKVEGSVVAWGTVDLNRNLGGVENTNGPAEKFTHRPDLLTNMPQKMKTFAMQWQELPAGSF